MSFTEEWLRTHGYELREDGWHKTDGVAPDAKRERDPRHEPVATSPGKDHDPKRCRVRITSYRRVLADERNLFDKYFVDALERAGAIYSDSPTWCHVQVEQVKVGLANQERTEMEVICA